MRIKSDNIPIETVNLTSGQWYNVIDDKSFWRYKLVYILDDQGKKTLIRTKGSAYSEMKAWDVES